MTLTTLFDGRTHEFSYTSVDSFYIRRDFALLYSRFILIISDDCLPYKSLIFS